MIRPLSLWLALFALTTTLGCADEIGDECKTALDCSSQASRLCDRTQPGGYCTIKGCERGTCPEESVCVKFRPSQERLAVTYCMYSCREDDDCRNDEGYRCHDQDDFAMCGEAETLDGANKRFCSAPPRAAVPESGDGDGNMTPPDGVMIDSGVNASTCAQ